MSSSVSMNSNQRTPPADRARNFNKSDGLPFLRKAHQVPIHREAEEDLAGYPPVWRFMGLTKCLLRLDRAWPTPTCSSNTTMDRLIREIFAKPGNAMARHGPPKSYMMKSSSAARTVSLVEGVRWDCKRFRRKNPKAQMTSTLKRDRP
jgi:hypothetical protein